MLSDDFYRYMQEPSCLADASLEELSAVVEKYPYFHAAGILLLKKLSIDKSPDFPCKLQQLSSVLPDRKKLFVLIEDLVGELSISEGNGTTSDDNDTFTLIDAFLQDSGIHEESESSLVNTLIGSSVASSDYFNWSLSSSPETGETEESDYVHPEQNVQLKHQNLIDSFIEGGEHRLIAPKSLKNNKPEEKTDNPELPLPKQPENSYFTETLARIYVKQKRYDKALQIIKNLSLKYPEKNVYFADQIRFLEKLIINTKK
ncbi:MAG: hypothetical protein SOR57_01220 [Parabacteroides sp.]|nr:hypothetical protein [Parabacteroides sp.]